jgi:hypothetical protein
MARSVARTTQAWPRPLCAGLPLLLQSIPARLTYLCETRLASLVPISASPPRLTYGRRPDDTTKISPLPCPHVAQVGDTFPPARGVIRAGKGHSIKTAAVILGWPWRRRFASLEVGEASDGRVSGPSGAEANSLEIDVLGNVSQGRTMESHYPCRMSLSPRWLPG